jgi:hypothetical protein
MKSVHFAGSQEFALADAIRRVRADFLEMPGMRLTPRQAARWWHFELDFCDAVLSALVDTRFLVKTHDKKFARA